MALVWCGQVNGSVLAVASFETPFGSGQVMASPDGIVSVDWGKDDEEVTDWHAAARTAVPLEDDDELKASGLRAEHWAQLGASQVMEYFGGARTTFDVPMIYNGTEFQVAVWNYLQSIPYGETRSYGEVARAIGRDKAVRAVGQANRANPIAIMIPCHRVIGSSGALTGYAGSKVHLKAGLLDLEKRLASDRAGVDACAGAGEDAGGVGSAHLENIPS